MQVNSVSLNSSPSFGIKCRPEIAEKLAQCLTKKGEKVAFSEGAFLAKNISSIGSQATELIGVDFVKASKPNFFRSEIPNDMCILKFKLTTPDGEFETLGTSISSIKKLCKRVHNKSKKIVSSAPTTIYTNLFKQFQETLKHVERGFIKNTILDSVKNGNTMVVANKLAKIYPLQKGFIFNFVSSPKNLNLKNNIPKVEKVGIIKKLFGKFFSD